MLKIKIFDPDRDRDIVAKRIAGMTFTALAKQYGLTRERCRQICKQAGLPNRTQWSRHKKN